MRAITYIKNSPRSKISKSSWFFRLFIHQSAAAQVGMKYSVAGTVYVAQQYLPWQQAVIGLMKESYDKVGIAVTAHISRCLDDH